MNVYSKNTKITKITKNTKITKKVDSKIDSKIQKYIDENKPVITKNNLWSNIITDNSKTKIPKDVFESYISNDNNFIDILSSNSLQLYFDNINKLNIINVLKSLLDLYFNITKQNVSITHKILNDYYQFESIFNGTNSLFRATKNKKSVLIDIRQIFTNDNTQVKILLLETETNETIDIDYNELVMFLNNILN